MERAKTLGVSGTLTQRILVRRIRNSISDSNLGCCCLGRSQQRPSLHPKSAEQWHVTFAVRGFFLLLNLTMAIIGARLGFSVYISWFLFSITVRAQSLSPITVKGSKFFDSDGKQFYIKGLSLKINSSKSNADPFLKAWFTI